MSSSSELSQAARRRHVALAGELDVATGPAAFVHIMQTRPRPGDMLTVDLGDVTFMDSSGIAMLLKAKCYLEGGDCQLVLTNVSQPVRRLIQLLGLTETFSLEDGPTGADAR